MNVAIETQHLRKDFVRSGIWGWFSSFNPTTAVDDVSLRIERGEFFGLLGPNGAGKTTLVKMLCTLVLPTSGTARVAGHPLQEAAAIRAAVGLAVTDERSFYWRLTGRENLAFFAAMYGLHGKDAARRVDQVLDAVEMTPWADRRVSDYSSGMRQRIAIARSLLHRPQILFLDEPSRSLDPKATERLHALLRRLVEQQDVTVFLITHDLSEAEKLCDRLGVMDGGRIRAVGRPSELRQRLARRLHYRLRVDRLEPLTERALRSVIPALHVQRAGGLVKLQFDAPETDSILNRVLDRLRRDDVTIFSIEGTTPTLEEVFRRYTETGES